ncbi:coiled-coil domain-containing protein 62 isoform X5 [Cygnus olor]|uniref:coiled-coil domain-containing protein 62 isoform X5 n=1 Tax=Cygnus olor TaxID=8869 RepID=UPI001ADE7E56|nr:coiled-coil domain-containing protein 62 isoform X5 [Cygnus olor]XP_040432855.1 coiled-coil domain-containing protein 62 isoform X5 [Cygnus olor]
MNPARPRSASPQKFSPSFENSTIEKQRRELQALIAELKDRDEELNAMVAVHQTERLAWEDDRQKILTLAERCALLNNELNKRNDVIKSLTKKLKLLESQQSDSKTICEITQQKFKELSQKLTDVTLHCQGLEEENQILRCSVLELSAKKGQLLAREQELLKKLELKGEAILETTDYITEFTSKLKLESALRAAKAEEFSLNKEKQDLRLRLRELILETDELKDDLCEKMKENNKQEEEIIHLKQENASLKNELALNVEKAKRKDQLLQFAKSKQVRTDTELSSLRQIYVKQQRDLQFLHVSLENSQELRQKHEKVAYERSEENVDLNSFHLDSPRCLTSTQKGDRPQRCEKFSDANSPLDIGNLSVIEPKNRCCNPTINKDARYPTSKLQRALAESQQMVADLELSTLLHMSPHCSPNSSSINTTTELAETLHRTQLSGAEERGAKLPFFSL